MEKFFNGEELNPLKKFASDSHATPKTSRQLCGSSRTRTSGAQLTDASTCCRISARSLRPRFWAPIPKPATNSPSSRTLTDEPFSALAFKIVADKFGRLYFRVDPGVWVPSVFESWQAKRARFAHFAWHANKREDVDFAGRRFRCAVGFSKPLGDTLCDEANPIMLEKTSISRPNW